MLRADGVEFVLEGGRRILGPASLDVAPGTLTALVGPSGSGKTTFLRQLAGITLPTSGTVTLDDDPATRRVEDLGYVPQRETVHQRLTVREALEYAAILRLDADEDITMRVDQVLRELDLEAQADTWVGDLSGGERRRAACGQELVGRPRVLLLDEPTSGLDPVLERRLMLMFRRLADNGRAVVVATHATASLDLCDTVAVMRGGVLTITDDPEVAVESLRQAAGGDRAPDPLPEGETAPEDPPRLGIGTRPFGLEYRALAGRYARTLLRDRKTLRILLGQSPIIGILIVLCFDPKAFDDNGDQVANTVMFIFLLMTGAIWLGITASCREIVKERGIIEREFDVGLRSDAYVLAKATVLFALSTVQVVLMMVVVVLLQPLGESGGAVLALIGLAVLVSWVSVALGLTVSAVARSVDQAAGVIPLVLIPQLLFAGAVIPLARMPAVASAFAQVTYARWAYAGMGSAINLDDRLLAKPSANTALGFNRSFFAMTPMTGAAALVCFLLILLALTAMLLQWRAPVDDA
ncbi:ABC transporter permease [Paraconexibacter antarcticus]|uniref:ABC transporter permease n=1 Tax=Paraconexibacter antarcticus TaxID=2949664 RepID=A0ABY5DNB5_9ACTN|nr:ABC transporter permease [Paraconexibacter antarcticus]UTI63513.1 ABC transporter permease [Paraconexibacter antarcticus]